MVGSTTNSSELYDSRDQAVDSQQEQVSRRYFCSSLYEIPWFILFVFFPLTRNLFNLFFKHLYRALG